MKTLRPGKPAGSADRSFTLIELMVAASITTLLLLGMTGIFDQSMKAWRLSSRRGDAEREVRAVLTMIQKDFSGLIVQSNLPVIRVTNSSDGGLIGPSLSPAYGPSVAVFFLTTSAAGTPSGATSGDLAGVGYYLAWTTNYRPAGSYDLYRYYLSGTNLLRAMSNYLTTSNGLFPVSLSPSGDELVGANVVNFRAEFKTLPLLFGPVTSQDGPRITSRPGYVQLELTAYGSEAARSLATSNDWLATNSIQRFARTFLWRVDL